jgi:serine/threonine protein phosphatase PrpC
MVAEQIKRGLLMTAENARDHPERSILLRNLGHELIVSVAKISIPLLQGDRVIVCSGGLYNVLRDREIERLSRGLDAVAACRSLVGTANKRGTDDDLTWAVFRMIATMHRQSEPAKDAIERRPLNRYPNAEAMLEDLRNPSSVRLEGRAKRLKPISPEMEHFKHA